MTDLELEATVVNAETQLLTAVLYLLEESKIGLIKSAMTVRSGWKLYERADASIGGYVSSVRAADGSLGMRGGVGPASSDQMMMIGDEDDDAVLDDSVAESAEASPTVTEAATGEGATGGAGGTSVPAAPPSVQSNVHPSVLGGVLFGVGSFNILLSTLPPLILRIVKALGFPHNQLRLLCCGIRMQVFIILPVLQRRRARATETVFPRRRCSKLAGCNCVDRVRTPPSFFCTLCCHYVLLMQCTHRAAVGKAGETHRGSSTCAG